MQALYVFFVFKTNPNLFFLTLSELYALIKYCFYLPLRVSFGLVANVLYCLVAQLLGRRHLILTAPHYVLSIFLKKGTYVLYMLNIYTWVTWVISPEH